MNRREFVKHFGISVLGTTLLSSVSGCSSEIDNLIQVEHDLDSSPQCISYFLDYNDIVHYENYPNIFFPNKRIFVINDYEFITEEAVLRRKKIDFYIKLNVLAVLNSDFEIYRFENKISTIQKVDENNYTMLTDIPGQVLSLKIAPMISNNMYVALRNNKNTDTLSFDKYYRLPCTMKVNTFKRLINNKISI